MMSKCLVLSVEGVKAEKLGKLALALDDAEALLVCRVAVEVAVVQLLISDLLTEDPLMEDALKKFEHSDSVVRAEEGAERLFEGTICRL